MLPEQLWREMVFAARRLRATSVFTIFAAASLALGVGATTAVYSAIHSLLWSSTGVQDADRVIMVARSSPAGGRVEAVTRQDLDALPSIEACCERIAASARVAITFGDGTWTEGLHGEAVTGAYFQLLGVRAATVDRRGPRPVDWMGRRQVRERPVRGRVHGWRPTRPSSVACFA